jgi:hypothetical protein
MRIRLAILVLGVIVVGLAARFLLPGAVGDVAGGLLYTICAALVIAVAVPRIRPALAAVVALAWSILVELLQLAGVARALAEIWPPFRLVFGTTFVWTDLLVYAVGAVIAWALLLRLRASSPGGTR